MDIIKYAKLKKLLGGSKVSGFLKITEDGIFDVSEYAKAKVAVVNGKPFIVDEYPSDYKENAVYLVNDSEFVYNGETLLAQLHFTSNGDGTCYVSKGNKYVGRRVIIPLVSPNGDSVTSIGHYAFQYCQSLTSIAIPDSVTSIDGGAFYGCYSLTSVEIPNSVTSIEPDVFHECMALTSVEIPDSVTSIGYNAFSKCISLKSVVIGDSVTSIGDSAFYGCTSLTSIEIPDSVTSIGYNAFYDCTSLVNIIFEGTVEQWNAISKGARWSSNVPATYVQCTDGQVPLTEG